ncbi:UNKNOWN [Stylonychia lemnae]|uniref:Transmembrane protein n=1 Tax=Stylonychia lemnae TaxID=5949 RepID=A0A078B3U4_STYLE|nr:UNKNOWN [Stylonychia lemnae]|eukprot:CDW89215.1 UNKNOWN [Stylonychia lemnae]
MKGQNAQQEFHNLLQEYMGKYNQFQDNNRENLKEKSILNLYVALSFISVLVNSKVIQDFQVNSVKSAGQKLRERTTSKNTFRFAQLNAFNRDKASSMKLNSQLGMNLPYEAPVYRSYFEAYLGLYKQGIRGFYKGNGVRCLHLVLFHRLNTDLTLYSESTFPQQVKQLKQIPILQELMLSCVVDFALHPLHVAEARFIMQNRRKNFAIYQSIGDFFRKSYTEMFRGIILHIPRNICIAMTYPFLTVQRRLECQSNIGIALLKNNEYSGFFNAMKRIYSEEGALAFYRGYSAHILAIMLWMSVLPKLTDIMMNKIPILSDIIGNKSESPITTRDPYGLDDNDEDDD